MEIAKSKETRKEQDKEDAKNPQSSKSKDKPT